MRALLDIDNFFVEELAVKANPEYIEEASGDNKVRISFDIKREKEKSLFL